MNNGTDKFIKQRKINRVFRIGAIISDIEAILAESKDNEQTFNGRKQFEILEDALRELYNIKTLLTIESMPDIAELEDFTKSYKRDLERTGILYENYRRRESK